jgi:hypothetical protein
MRRTDRQALGRLLRAIMLRIIVMAGAVLFLMAVVLPRVRPSADDWGQARGSPEVPVPQGATLLEHGPQGSASRELWAVADQDAERLFGEYHAAMVERGWQGPGRPTGVHDWTYRKGNLACRIVVLPQGQPGGELRVLLVIAPEDR